MEIFAGKNRKWKTLNEALDSLDDRDFSEITIRLDPGIYKEKVTILRPGIKLVGAGVENTIISWNDGALGEDPSGIQIGTFNSYTLYIGGDNFFAENLTIENTAGEGHLAGQAIAVYADADLIHFRKCSLLGHQDTLCTGPLPVNPRPVMPPPKLSYHYTDESPRPFRQFYENCRISGDVDFIFGSARALFYQCTIESLKRDVDYPAYITAGSHTKEESIGYQFIDCHLSGTAPTESIYLGRPWRADALVHFINCRMDKHIKPEGWHNWDDKVKEEACRYRETGSSGSGAGNRETRVKWADYNPKPGNSELPAWAREVFYSGS